MERPLDPNNVWQRVIESCDERILSCNECIKHKQTSMELMSFMYQLQENTTSTILIKNIELEIKNKMNSKELIKLEKIIYNALILNNFVLLPLLVQRYDDKMNESIEFGNEMVLKEIIQENEFLEFTSGIKRQRDYIYNICKDHV